MECFHRETLKSKYFVIVLIFFLADTARSETQRYRKVPAEHSELLKSVTDRFEMAKACVEFEFLRFK